MIVNVSLYIKCIFIHQGSVFSSFFLAFFKFSAFFSLFSSVRGTICETSFFIFFSIFFSSGCFFFDFYFTDQAAHFSVFIDLFDFTIIFSVFMVLIFFSRCHVFLSSFPSFWLTFLFFCKQISLFLFYQHFLFLLSVFYPSSPFHTIFLPFTASPSVFILFRPCLYYIFPFSVVFCLFSTPFLSFCFFRLFHLFTPSFAIF